MAKPCSSAARNAEYKTRANSSFVVGAASLITPEVSEIIAISKKGQVIKTDIDSISLLGRQTQGVKIMKPRAGDSLASLTCL